MISQLIAKLAAQGIQEVLLIPLFPHYAMSSFETAVERVKESVAQQMPFAKLVVQPPFYDYPEYIEALVASSTGIFSRFCNALCTRRLVTTSGDPSGVQTVE